MHRIRLTARNALDLAFLLLGAGLSTLTAFAQTNTPVPPTAIPPTATMIGITVDANAFFTATNTWMGTFAPVLAIGIGIAIALAILTFVGKQILMAFR